MPKPSVLKKYLTKVQLCQCKDNNYFINHKKYEGKI